MYVMYNGKEYMSETTLYLIRHGATDANLRRPYILQGSGINLPLNETGQEQAALVGTFLSGLPIQHVYSSPLIRAKQTAEAIARHHQLGVAAVEDLQECNVGRWEGMDWGSISQQHPEEYKAFMENPSLMPYLGGESYADVQKRATPAINQLLKQHSGETVVIVAHNVVNRAYISGILGQDLRFAKDLRQSNCCVNILKHEEGATRLITMNSHFHTQEPHKSYFTQFGQAVKAG